ncbi:cold shock domain-containing protein [Pseudoalteromonas sp. L23]|uniref:cold shock domain-containing protein n=1 Tax=unclassified Pseudoalteromonas TaxID=194690 RepID=UPI001F23D2E4|nr:MULTISPECIES: cold shock domain-containing protein [unclassified Pseudoalteromonas]MCF7515333.1 cold shock domain-containing protein [Pseudoalteromonas sp. L7]MCF7527488.1 cold shock domain-containing protein [Pseudoalteromonas sp. L23]MCF2826360.1 cold shock domain-containing protein [Pseudoalteromonas sp. OF5H-5]MCF2834536.1 cold shock domain-containing protein [Pseudoalteromonas sp. DL2-H6]MCF2926393.1 cold shock domain-containing protein [Pseudoalteromonas sp. DL2-H1]
MKGKVKWFSSEKGYGFITSELGDDHYFNVQDIIGADLPDNGDQVDFESAKSAKGFRAKNTRIISKVIKEERRDDRIECTECSRKIVPRIITDKGSLDHSVCPYCGTWIEDFSILRNLIGGVFNLAVKYPIPALVIVVIGLIAGNS